ncbi:hypothetical protein M427DRAFT_220992 [Gonapodya prolifera JEL478]|uniref:Uncharacterized protein n=1 Tax=Gonapodya prolifera (strain JEL478) TaxID=1344416 RepID=A0A138ZYG0_GONPJ|nr:hypothetical protein M427DRAFT_220992 [Gonapodya prolifera JEL478]|eukprot:KXS09537.1 hypothetical protein M427DRAFT_220992 [Gonapodya prolifera JEL478]
MRVPHLAVDVYWSILWICRLIPLMPLSRVHSLCSREAFRQCLEQGGYSASHLALSETLSIENACDLVTSYWTLLDGRCIIPGDTPQFQVILTEAILVVARQHAQGVTTGNVSKEVSKTFVKAEALYNRFYEEQAWSHWTLTAAIQALTRHTRGATSKGFRMHDTAINMLDVVFIKILEKVQGVENFPVGDMLRKMIPLLNPLFLALIHGDATESRIDCVCSFVMHMLKHPECKKELSNTMSIGKPVDLLEPLLMVSWMLQNDDDETKQSFGYDLIDAIYVPKEERNGASDEIVHRWLRILGFIEDVYSFRTLRNLDESPFATITRQATPSLLIYARNSKVQGMKIRDKMQLLHTALNNLFERGLQLSSTPLFVARFSNMALYISLTMLPHQSHLLWSYYDECREGQALHPKTGILDAMLRRKALHRIAPSAQYSDDFLDSMYGLAKMRVVPTHRKEIDDEFKPKQVCRRFTHGVKTLRIHAEEEPFDVAFYESMKGFLNRMIFDALLLNAFLNFYTPLKDDNAFLDALDMFTITMGAYIARVREERDKGTLRDIVGTGTPADVAMEDVHGEGSAGSNQTDNDGPDFHKLTTWLPQESDVWGKWTAHPIERRATRLLCFVDRVKRLVKKEVPPDIAQKDEIKKRGEPPLNSDAAGHDEEVKQEEDEYESDEEVEEADEQGKEEKAEGAQMAMKVVGKVFRI